MNLVQDPVLNLCIDRGNNADANTAYGDDVWQTLTTDADGALDVTPVDMGVHYQP